MCWRTTAASSGTRSRSTAAILRSRPLNDVRWRALPVASKPAPYSPNRESPVPGDNVALVLRDTGSGRSAVYAPGLGAMEEPLWRALQAADCVLVDGTFWTDDEMIALGLSGKRARRHRPPAAERPGGMLEWLEKLPAVRAGS